MQNENFLTKIFQKILMIIFVRKAEIFEYYGNCRHGLGVTIALWDPVCTPCSESLVIKDFP